MNLKTNRILFNTSQLKKLFAFSISLLILLTASATLKYSINEGWRFSKIDLPDNCLMSCDDSKWELINLPHTWNKRDATDDEPGYYRGTGWYRKKIFIDSSVSNKVVLLYFDGANQVTELYVNGKLAGLHKGGYTRFSFDISQYIQPGTENLIAIKVNNSPDVSIPPLSADFSFFGGIYRNLYLQIKEQTGLSLADYASDGVYIKTHTVTAKKAIVDIQSLLDNGLNKPRTVEIIQTVIDHAGREVKTWRGQTVLAPNSVQTIYKSQIAITDPLLWSPDTPQLYTLKTVVRDPVTKNELDQQLNSFGLRWFHFDPQHGFSINGRHIKLIGTNRHQCYLGKGNALPDELHVEDIRLLKEMGGNMLRISHYPQDPLVLQMCDQLGIITSVEIPIVNEITESETFLQNSLYMAKEMVKQNFNHPSVVIWAYMNEVLLRPPFYGDSSRHQQYCHEVNRQARSIEDLLRTLDPDRYTMIPFHGALQRYEEAGLVQVPMIVGWNLYQGWYGGKFDDFDSFLASYHKKYPTIPVLITEYGADVDDRLHSFQPERFDYSVEYGDLYHQHYLQTILRNDFIAGATIWNLNDFYSETREDVIPHVNTKGINTLDRHFKNTYLLYKVALSKEPLAYIGSKSWISRAGTDNGHGTCIQPVKIYANQARVDVYHNGVLFKKLDMAQPWQDLEIPFSNGKNNIELRIGNKTLDFAEINFKLLPLSMQNAAISDINVMLGSNRYFEDREAKIIWIPEKPYSTGSWGYIGGRAVRPQTRSGSLPSTAINIYNTDQDPLFQTQREDLQSFRLDVPDGQYALYLYWADLKADTASSSVYNLGNKIVGRAGGRTVMNVLINDLPVLTHFEISGTSKHPNAIIKKIVVDAMDKKGITIKLEAVQGKTVLNAIRVIRLN